MTQAEIKEILNKQVNQLEMLISAAKQRGDINEVNRLFVELEAAKQKIIE
jgi:hypothetical protein